MERSDGPGPRPAAAPHDADDLRRDPALHPHRGHSPGRAAGDDDPRPPRRDRRRGAPRLDEPRLAARAGLDGRRAAARPPTTGSSIPTTCRASRPPSATCSPPAPATAPRPSCGCARPRATTAGSSSARATRRASATCTSRARTSPPASRREEELRAAEERFAAVTRSTRDAIVSADLSGRIVFWNAAAETIFGHRAADALGRPLTELVPERDRDAHSARAWRTSPPRARSPRCRARWSARACARTARSSRWSCPSAAGATPGSATSRVVIRDVTDRVRARRALREAEERFAGAFQGAAVGLALVAPDGTLLRANRALCELAGRPEPELAGRAARRPAASRRPRRRPRGDRGDGRRAHGAPRDRAPLPHRGRPDADRAHQPLADPRRRRRRRCTSSPRSRT